MNLKKKISENLGLLTVIILALFLYQFSVSNGNYTRDPAQLAGAIEYYIKTNDIGLVKNTYLYSVHPFYVIFVTLFYRFFSFIPIATFLNEVSVFFAVISIAPLFFFLRQFFKNRIAMYATVLYVFLPFVWFHAVYSGLYSMELFFVNLWLYLIFSLKKTIKNLTISTVLLGLMPTIHLINLLLLPLFLYTIKNTKIKIILFCLSIFAITFLSSRALTSFNIEPYVGFAQSWLNKFSLSSIVFTIALGSWEIFNALTLMPAILTLIGFYYGIKRNFYFILFWIAPFVLAFLPGLDIVDGFTPLFPAFILLIALVFEKIKNDNLIEIILTVCILLIFIKFFPFVLVTHIYESPHDTYAKLLLNISKPTTILGGHECPWLYGKLKCYATGDSEISKITNYSSYVITSHFFMNENRYEFLQYKNLLPKFEIIEYTTTIKKESLCEIGKIVPKHNYEDPYWYFFGISPSLQWRLIFLGKPAYNETYKIYIVC